jgi:hypothetical protein
MPVCIVTVWPPDGHRTHHIAIDEAEAERIVTTPIEHTGPVVSYLFPLDIESATPIDRPLVAR